MTRFTYHTFSSPLGLNWNITLLESSSFFPYMHSKHPPLLHSPPYKPCLTFIPLHSTYHHWAYFLICLPPLKYKFHDGSGCFVHCYTCSTENSTYYIEILNKYLLNEWDRTCLCIHKSACIYQYIRTDSQHWRQIYRKNKLTLRNKYFLNIKRLL